MISDLPIDADLFKAIAQGLPIGLSVSAGDGTAVFVNVEARRHADPSNVDRILQVDRRTVSVAGHSFKVSTSLDITGQRRLENELFQRAYFDSLTTLPNRSLAEKTVKSLIDGTDGAGLALAFIDIDNFKHINDYYGHSVGDGLLVKIAQRISSQIRDTDLLARVGGDEFMLLMTPAGDLDDVKAAMDRLFTRLKEPFFVDGHEIFSSASVGVSLFPLHGSDYETLRINADSAMYRLKATDKGGVKIYESTIGHAASERMKLEQRLRLAIRDRRLCCAFQPKMNFRSETVTGIEVLLRWRDEHGLIHAPGDFVNLAVELKLMDDITHLVLAETVDAIDSIDCAFGPDTTISVNVAAKQAEDSRFMTGFADAIRSTGYPERFMIEVTEEAFLSKGRFQASVLPLLRERGIRVSLDDFGVGYSSLSALADITADELKVDRSFITDIHKRPRSQMILKAIESLGNALDMSICVEGVETAEELAYLKTATQISTAQGYHFARPVLLEQLLADRVTSGGDRQILVSRDAPPPRLHQRRLPRLDPRKPGLVAADKRDLDPRHR